MSSSITVLFTEVKNDDARGRHYYAVTYIPGEDPASLRSDVCDSLWAYEPMSSRLCIEETNECYRWRDFHEAVERHAKDNSICFVVKENC